MLFAMERAWIHNANSSFSVVQPCVNVCACVSVLKVCVCERESVAGSSSSSAPSWHIESSGNHSLSMYGSSCGSPCLILHACGECHNTFTSHSSTSSLGQAREEKPPLCVRLCFFLNSCTVAPYICMGSWPLLSCMHTVHVCLLADMYGCLCLFMYKHACVLPLKPASMLANILSIVA